MTGFKHTEQLGLHGRGQLADLVVYSPDLDLGQKVQVLETLDIRARLGLVIDLMRNVLADFELRKKVRDEAAEKIEVELRGTLGLIPGSDAEDE